MERLRNEGKQVVCGPKKTKKQEKKWQPGPSGRLPDPAGDRGNEGSLDEPRIGMMQRERSLSASVLRVYPRGACHAE